MYLIYILNKIITGSVLCFLRPTHHCNSVNQQCTQTWSWCLSHQTTPASAPANEGLRPARPARVEMSYDEQQTCVIMTKTTEEMLLITKQQEGHVVMNKTTNKVSSDGKNNRSDALL